MYCHTLLTSSASELEPFELAGPFLAHLDPLPCRRDWHNADCRQQSVALPCQKCPAPVTQGSLYARAGES